MAASLGQGCCERPWPYLLGEGVGKEGEGICVLGGPCLLCCRVCVCVCVCLSVAQLCPTLLPFATSGDLPDPGIEPVCLAFPALAGGFFTTCVTWE